MRRDFQIYCHLGKFYCVWSPPDNPERIVRGDTFQKQVGGAELNVVSGVSLLGLRTGMISMLPDNALGTYAKNRVRFCGVSDDYLIYDKDTDARLGIYYYENGAYPRKPVRAWFMIESMRPFASFPQMIFRAKCTAQQDASIPQELHWHCQKIPVKMP